MLFTAQPLPRNQTASEVFQNFGANNLAPASVTDSKIHPVLSNKDQHISLNYRIALPAIITAMTSGFKPVAKVIGATNAVHLQPLSAAEFLFDIPISVTCVKKPTESTIAKFKEIGFAQQSKGPYSFFQGVATATSIQRALALGAELFVFAPQERVSFGGAITCFAMRKLLFLFFQSSSVAKRQIDYNKGLTVDKSELESFKSFVPTTSGHFLPYFPGLVLPDKSCITLFLTIFAGCIGTDMESRNQTVNTFIRGWNSTANTAAGRQVSHMVYGAYLAVEGGFVAKPIFRSGDYVGMFLGGSSQLIFLAETHDPKDAATINEEIASVTSHDTALAEIVKKLAPLKTRDGDVKSIDIQSITTARALHYLCADRVIKTLDTQKEITALVKKLRFRQTYFRVSAPHHVYNLLEVLTSKQRFDINVPFDLLGGALFTTSLTYSSLSAFGAVAPAPSLQKDANSTLMVKEKFTRGNQQGSLEGIPIFALPIQEAVEAWKVVKRTGSIHYRVKGKNANNVAKLHGVSRYITAVEEEGRQAQILFIKYARNALKRKIGDDNGEDFTGEITKELARDREVKKLRKDKETVQASVLLGWGDKTATAADEEMDFD